MQMQRWIVGIVLLGATALPGYSQKRGQLDLEVGYAANLNNLTSGSSVLLQGGGAELTAHIWHNYAAVASLTGLHTSAASAGLPQDMIIATFGPRYTLPRSGKRPAMFVQALFGEADGFHGIFPGRTSADDTASGIAVKAGGGIDLLLRSRISIRPIQVDFLYTQLPNGTNNMQNSLLIGAGIVFHTKQR